MHHYQPTNNLDLEAVVALADAVDSFEGGVVVVSHDQVRVLMWCGVRFQGWAAGQFR